MNHLKSLREFLDALGKIGDLQKIDVEVDWNLEMGGNYQKVNGFARARSAFQPDQGCATGVSRVWRTGRDERATPGTHSAASISHLAIQPTAIRSISSGISQQHDHTRYWLRGA